MSYKPIFIFESGERCTNAQRFATNEEARLSANARFQRWTMPTGFDVESSNDPVNYRYENGEDISIKTQQLGDAWQSEDNIKTTEVEVVPGLVVVGDHADKIAAKIKDLI